MSFEYWPIVGYRIAVEPGFVDFQRAVELLGCG